MKMCNEMIKLRAELDKRGISWEDKSSIVPQEAIEMMVAQGIDARFADSSMFRTHFNVGDYHYSVIYGYGSYGGVDVFGNDKGLLECMTEKVNGGEPLGSLTADDVMAIIDGQEE